MNLQYANLPSRVKAAFIDAMVLIGMMYGASELLGLFESVPNYVRIILAVFIFILYDPIFVSQFGATIGHSQSKISVKRDGVSGQKVSFLAALLRFIIKALLGWISLLTITSNEKRKAIHDFIVNSVVVEEYE